MRQTIFALAALTLAASPALANDDDTNAAYGAAVVVAYDKQCEKVPRYVVDAAYEVVATVPNSAVKTATERLLESYKRIGLTAFCAGNRPTIDRLINNLR